MCALGGHGAYARYMAGPSKDLDRLEELSNIPPGQGKAVGFTGQLKVRLEVSPGPKMLHRGRGRGRGRGTERS